MAQLVKNSPAMQERPGFDPGLGRSAGEGKGYPLQVSGWRIHGPFSACGHKELDMTERLWASLVAQTVKNLPTIDLGSVAGLGRSPGEGNGNPLQCSCLENFMDRGAWQGTVYGVSKSQTRLSN